jgi:hypothetical protein
METILKEIEKANDCEIDQSGYEEDFEMERWREERAKARAARNRELYGTPIYRRSGAISNT